jgi:hypothetical protein
MEIPVERKRDQDFIEKLYCMPAAVSGGVMQGLKL